MSERKQQLIDLFLERYFRYAPEHLVAPCRAELQELTEEQLIYLDDHITFPLTDEKQLVLTEEIPEQMVIRLGKTYVIWSSIKQARDEGRYETSEHMMSSVGTTPEKEK